MANRGLAEGDAAPDFTLPQQGGGQFGLAEALGRGPVVLYFYPADGTPGCTAEACGFRDRYAEFTEAGAAVVGVSRDPLAAHDRFAQRYGLPFPLLSDVDGEVHRRYGVGRALGGLIPGRVTFVIDATGTVRRVFDSIVPNAHIAAALTALRAAAG